MTPPITSRPDAPDISVVICAYTLDRWDDLARAVASVKAQTLAAHEMIVVIDHNDALRHRATDELAAVRVIENTGRRGLSDARNAGVRAATGSVIAFLDDDATAAPDWLALVARRYDDADVMGVGGSAEPEWPNSTRPRWFPEEFDWVVGCSYRGMPTSSAPVRNFLGCNMSFRRAAFELAGEFDPAVGRVGNRPVGCEETEFCIRLARRAPGHSLIYEPMARVRHRVPPARTSARYFWARCFSEGLSKAVVSELAGGQSALGVELRYTLRTLTSGVARNLAQTVIRLDPMGPVRAAAIVGGLAFTTAGYVSRRVLARTGRAGPISESASP